LSTESQWWVYMIETQSGKLYTGISTDIERRFLEHSDPANTKGAKFFRLERALSVVYREACANRSAASKRESAIKKMTKKSKWQLAGMTGKPV